MKCSSEVSGLGAESVAGECEAGASRYPDSTTSATSTVDLQKLARDLRVYAVTDRSWVGLAENATEVEKQAALYQQVRAAVEGGTTFVQMR